MKKGSKYFRLFESLQGRGEDDLTLTFAEIEATLNDSLPPSARTTRGWWSNRGGGSLQAAAWMEAGYHVEELDLESEQVTFRKPIQCYEVRRVGDIILWSGEMIKGLRAHMDMKQSDFASELGVRQQTVSEWETGIYEPKRAMSKLLMMIAEQAGFQYGEEM
ncbi:MAG: helix-turn-helix transcriptional regulator [Anaerolineales bacterium]|nr:helix-turn-helix transcriptional regulator [Anaerolineales bacterium]